MNLEIFVISAANRDRGCIADEAECIRARNATRDDSFVLLFLFLFALLAFFFFAFLLFFRAFDVTADAIDRGLLAQDVTESTDERCVDIDADFVHLPVGDVAVMASATEVSCNHATQELVLFRRVRSAVDIATSIFVAVVAAVVRFRGSLGSVTGKAYDVRLLVIVVAKEVGDVLFDNAVVGFVFRELCVECVQECTARRGAGWKSCFFGILDENILVLVFGQVVHVLKVVFRTGKVSLRMPLEIEVAQNVSNRACVRIAQTSELVLFEVNLIVILFGFSHIRGIQGCSIKFHSRKAWTIGIDALPPAFFVESLGIGNAILLLGIGKSGLCCLQVLFAGRGIRIHTGHDGEHCCCHTRCERVVCGCCDITRFATVTISELAHGTCGHPLVVVLVAIALHGHKMAIVNGCLDPEVCFVTEFFEKVAHIVWLAAFAGVVLAGLVVCVVACVKVVKALGKFCKAECQNVGGETLALSVHHVVAAVEPAAAHVFSVVFVTRKACRVVRAVKNPVRPLTGALGSIESGGHPSCFDEIIVA